MYIYQDMETLLEPHFSIQLETGTSFQFSNSKKPLEHPLVWKNAWARVRGRWEFYGCCGRRMGSQDGRKWLITVVIISPRSSVVLNQPARICSLLRWTLSNESHTFDGVIKLKGLRAWNLKWKDYLQYKLNTPDKRGYNMWHYSLHELPSNPISIRKKVCCLSASF